MKKYNYDINASISLKSNNYNQQANMQSVAPAKKNADSIKFVENLDILLAQEKKMQVSSTLATLNENSVSQFNTSISNTPSKLHMLTEVSQILLYDCRL